MLLTHGPSVVAECRRSSGRRSHTSRACAFHAEHACNHCLSRSKKRGRWLKWAWTEEAEKLWGMAQETQRLDNKLSTLRIETGGWPQGSGLAAEGMRAEGESDSQDPRLTLTGLELVMRPLPICPSVRPVRPPGPRSSCLHCQRSKQVTSCIKDDRPPRSFKCCCEPNLLMTTACELIELRAPHIHCHTSAHSL